MNRVIGIRTTAREERLGKSVTMKWLDSLEIPYFVFCKDPERAGTWVKNWYYHACPTRGRTNYEMFEFMQTTGAQYGYIVDRDVYGLHSRVDSVKTLPEIFQHMERSASSRYDLFGPCLEPYYNKFRDLKNNQHIATSNAPVYAFVGLNLKAYDNPYREVTDMHYAEDRGAVSTVGKSWVLRFNRIYIVTPETTVFKGLGSDAEQAKEASDLMTFYQRFAGRYDKRWYKSNFRRL